MMEAVPIRDAIILPDGTDPFRPVAGVPLLVRTILTLQRAGIERCTLVGRLMPPQDRRIMCRVLTASVLTPPADPALRLVVGAGTVIDVALVRELQTRARADTAVDLEADGARVRIAPGPLVAATGGSSIAPRAGTLRRADGPGVDQALLEGLENPRDGYLDRVLHRRLSRPLTRLLLRTPLSANAVTVGGIALGMAGGLLLGAVGPGAIVLALLLLETSAVLDCSDGEIARLRFAESRLGHWLDIAGDTVVHLALLAGIAVRLARAGSLPGRPVLVALLLGIAGAFAMVTWSEETEGRRHRIAAWENRLLDGVLAPLTTRDWHVFPVLFALVGRLDLLVLAAAVGANVFWVTGLVLLCRVLRRARFDTPCASVDP